MTSSPLTDEQLDEMEARCAAATEGPWRYRASEIDGDWFVTTGALAEIDGPSDVIEVWHCGEADVALMTAARTDIPALLAEVRALRARVGELEGALEHIARGAPEKQTDARSYKAGFDNAHYWAGAIARTALKGGSNG